MFVSFHICETEQTDVCFKPFERTTERKDKELLQNASDPHTVPIEVKHLKDQFFPCCLIDVNLSDRTQQGEVDVR